MRPEEIDHVVADSGAAFVIRSAHEVDGHEPLDQGRARPTATTSAALFYTSGTTGKPKGAALTHDALVGSLAGARPVPSGLRHDEAVVSLPVAHIMGFATLLGLAGAGIAAYFLHRFDAGAVLDAIEERRAAIFIGVPAMYRMLLEAGAADRDLGEHPGVGVRAPT